MSSKTVIFILALFADILSLHVIISLLGRCSNFAQYTLNRRGPSQVLEKAFSSVDHFFNNYCCAMQPTHQKGNKVGDDVERQTGSPRKHTTNQILVTDTDPKLTNHFCSSFKQAFLSHLDTGL